MTEENACDGDEQIMIVSTSFHPGMHTVESDLVFASSDGVLFYVHSDVLAKASPMSLASFLCPSIGVKDAIILIPESASLLNIIFHTLYQTSCAPNSPTCAELIEAVDKMPRYGIHPGTFIRPSSPLYTLLLSHAPLKPLEIYALAAHYNLSELAEQASSHLLAYPLDTISDATAARIGPAYLKRLFLLHMRRVETVKKLLLQPPGLHPPTRECSFDDQKKLTRAWALGSTYLAWDVRPDLSTHRIQSVFEPMAGNLSCKDCQDVLKRRIRDVIVSWAAVKCTI